MNQENISAQNNKYWNELCGSYVAQTLGIKDDNIESLKKFDNWYFSFYPYLFYHIPFEAMRGRDVLEVGLGYGTVSQRIAESGARLQALDIAEGPVSMVEHRLRQASLPGQTRLGSILNAPFTDGSFDFIVAIGCLHHTGDMPRAISECYRMLRPGGRLIFMVYNAYSYRRFIQARGSTLRQLARETFGQLSALKAGTVAERAAYDARLDGDAAPHTDFLSVRTLKRMCGAFSNFTARRENIEHGEKPFVAGGRGRHDLLLTLWPRFVGLDIYASATK